MKDTSNTPGKTVAVVLAAAAVVGVVTYLALPPAPPRNVVVQWDHPEPATVIFEIVSKTNLNSAWRFKTNVVGTNAVTFAASQAQEFFTISRVIDRENTNNFIKQKGF